MKKKQLPPEVEKECLIEVTIYGIKDTISFTTQQEKPKIILYSGGSLIYHGSTRKLIANDVSYFRLLN